MSSEKTLITEAYDVGKVEGKIEGKVEGKIERDIEIILNGYNNGFSITQLVQLTNLTEQEVLMILRDNGIEV
ncbi:hypothetical protein B0A58_01820 [Flavobacterium branchiophilum NBRC 15030 = ATCC 35035]|nr:hypothetical protein B0A58_01820 [Flavobacterium branchiophilum NBRC 15030 = ATCC 35035]